MFVLRIRRRRGSKERCAATTNFSNHPSPPDVWEAEATEVAALPDTFHRDPGDRLIVATARVLNLPLLSIDRRICDSGFVRVVRLSSAATRQHSHPGKEQIQRREDRRPLRSE